MSVIFQVLVLLFSLLMDSNLNMVKCKMTYCKNCVGFSYFKTFKIIEFVPFSSMI